MKVVKVDGIAVVYARGEHADKIVQLLREKGLKYEVVEVNTS